MPIKVTLVSPRSKMSIKVSSTVSVNSEFEYLNLPSLKSPRKTEPGTKQISSNRPDVGGHVSSREPEIESGSHHHQQKPDHQAHAASDPYQTKISKSSSHLPLTTSSKERSPVSPPARTSELPPAPQRPPKPGAGVHLNELWHSSETLRVGSVPSPVLQSVLKQNIESESAEKRLSESSAAGQPVNPVSSALNPSASKKSSKNPSQSHNQGAEPQKPKKAKHLVPPLLTVNPNYRSLSPSPPPPPRMSPERASSPIEDFFPPPPSNGTLKRMTSYRRSDRERRTEKKDRRIKGPDERSKMNSSLPVEPSSPARDAAKGAPGWQKFHGKTTGRSISVNLTQEEADLIRERRRSSRKENLTSVTETGRVGGQSNKENVVNPKPEVGGRPTEVNGADLARLQERKNSEMACDVTAGEDDEDPPPLPPKPKQKISVIGSPNSDQFIVMDNSSLFSSRTEVSETRLEVTGGKESKVTESRPDNVSTVEIPRLMNADLQRVISGADLQATVEPHSRSDSGLSSLSSWTANSSGGSSNGGTRSGSSSVRSSSIVSNSSAKLDELLGGQKRSSSIVSSCSMKLEELNEMEEPVPAVRRESRVMEKIKYFQSRSPDILEQEDMEDVELTQTSKETGVQRQLATIKQQKEKLIKEIMENEKTGMEIQKRLEQLLPAREVERFCVFLSEMEKVVLLLLSLCSRFERAEEELSCGNLTDWDKETIRFKRDKLEQQLKEANSLKEMSDRRQEKVENLLRKEVGENEVITFRNYISKREELLRSQRACEEAERSILPSV